MSFHIVKVIEVPDDSDPNVKPKFQAACVRQDCPWTSDLWDTERGAVEAAHSHESNGDRFGTGEHPVIEENER
jgi:hypothetical protein